MRTRALLAALVTTVASTLVSIVGATPAQAIECVNDSTTVGGVVLSRWKTCGSWDNSHRGASVTNTYSFYRSYDRVNDNTYIKHSFTLKDTQSDGNCAFVRAVKTESAWDFQSKQAEVCGVGKSKAFSLEWRELNMMPGILSLHLCESGNGCKNIWTQRIS